MNADDIAALRRLIDDLAQTLQAAIGLSAQLSREAQMVAGKAIALENSLARAASDLKRFTPHQSKSRPERL